MTSGRVCFGVWGPRARDLLGPLTTDDVSDAGVPVPDGARRSRSGGCRCSRVRVTYVGELGWELYAPTEFGGALWDTLWEAGREHGLVAAGYRAIDALRLEKGYRVWSSDITPDETPFEAGLGFAVKLDKETEFIGRDALVAAKAAGPRKRLRCLVLDDARAVCLGNEPVRLGGAVVGRVTSGGLRLRGRAVDRLRLPAAGRGDRDARRGGGLRRVDRLRGRPRAALRSRRRAAAVMTDAALRAGRGPPRSRNAPEAELDAWLALAHAAADEADAIARSTFRRDLQISTKPDRTLVTQADTAIERVDPGAHRGRVPGPRPRRRGVRHRSRRRPDPLVHRPDRRHPQLRPRRAAVRDAARGRAGRGAAGRGALGAGAPRALVGPAGRGSVGARRGRRGAAPDPRFAGRRRSADAAGAVRLRPGDRGVGPRAGIPTRSSATAWRERGFGDFWGYALLAEGAAEAMVEVGLSSWDAAAPTVLVEEAGGRVSDFEGRRAIDAGTFVATNGLLHDEVLARLRAHAGLNDGLPWRQRGRGAPVRARASCIMRGRDARDEREAIPWRTGRVRSARPSGHPGPRQPRRRRCGPRPPRRSARADDPDDRALEPADPRSLVYNEAFARGGMFLTFLTGTLVALGFVSQGTGFGREFLVVTTVLLAFVLVIGFATIGRLASASDEEFRRRTRSFARSRA